MLFPCNNCYFIAWLAALVDIMKQILCSDWLSERARLAHLALLGLTALILRKDKIAWSGLFWITSAMKLQKAAEN